MIIGLDFETETDKDNNCRPLLCCLNGEHTEKAFNLTVKEEYEEFYWTILLTGAKFVVYNASFDIEIIMTILLKNDFTFLVEDEQPRHKTMRLLMGQKIYKLETFFNDKGKLITSTFVDLANLIVGSSLKEIAKEYTNLEKGSYEGTKDNLEEFIKYCMLDSKITRIAYENIEKILGEEYLTIGGAAFDIMLKMNFPELSKRDRFKELKKILGDNTVEIDDNFRKWYMGGFGWASTDDRTECRINSYDIKSAYPSVSIDTVPTSKGMIVFKELYMPTKERPFSYIHMKITGQVKKNRCPVAPSRSIYGDSNVYIYDEKDVYVIKEYERKSEYDYFLENIEIDNIEYIETISLKQAPYNPLKQFMLEYYEKKSKAEGVEKEVDKRILNSLTGKLGSNPHKENVKFRLDERNVIKKDSSSEVIADIYFTHVVAVITSRVRCKCYEIDSLIRDKVSFRMYATDSVKHSSNIDIIQTGKTLGAWDKEYSDIFFIFLGLKAYIFDANNEKGMRKVLCAGISRNYKDMITNEDFYATSEVKSLISVRSGNGRIIYEGTKKIANPVKKPRRREELYGRYKLEEFGFEKNKQKRTK